MMTDKKAIVIGGGLAGVEAANQLSKRQKKTKRTKQQLHQQKMKIVNTFMKIIIIINEM